MNSGNNCAGDNYAYLGSKGKPQEISIAPKAWRKLGVSPPAHPLRLAPVSLIAIALFIRGPQSQVVAEQLHDECGILVRLFGNIVKLRNRLLEGLACHLASFIRLVEHLVLEDREVERKAETDWMRDRQIFLGDLLGSFIRPLCVLRCRSLCVAFTVLRNVAVVIGLHLLVEDLRLSSASFWDEKLIKEVQDLFTNAIELTLHCFAILLRMIHILIIAFAFFLLLNAADDAPSCTATSHSVLVGHGQEVALLDAKLVASLANLLHLLCHLIIALCLLRKLRKVDVLVLGHGGLGLRVRLAQLCEYKAVA